MGEASRRKKEKRLRESTCRVCNRTMLRWQVYNGICLGRFDCYGRFRRWVVEKYANREFDFRMGHLDPKSVIGQVMLDEWLSLGAP